jgi:GNAT superfamily N-acetyltransferase
MDLSFKKLNSDSSGLEEKIFQAISNEPGLSYRTKKEIKREIKRGGVYLASIGDQPVSFVFLSPLGGDFWEIGAAYTSPSHRRQGIFSQLLDYLQSLGKKNLLTVTFHDYAVKIFQKSDFQSIPLSRLPLSVKIIFIFKRFRLKRLFSIFKFYQTSKPTYLLWTPRS